MSSLAHSLGTIMVRELTSLKFELEAYATEADLWKVAPGISNSGGNLALHLAGNLQHFVGAALGKSGYVRNRDAEFSSTGVPRAEVIREVEAAIAVVDRTMKGLPDSVLEAEFPEPVAQKWLNTGDFLTHLACHLAYHLGQVDYHRRIVSSNSTTVGTVSPTRLWSARAAE